MSINIKRAFAAVVVLSLASCAPVPARVPAPAPAPARVLPHPAPPAPRVSLPAPASWMDVPATPGDWSYRQVSGKTQAIFGTSPDRAALVMTCDPARRTVSLFRAGSTDSTIPVRILTETITRSVSGTATSGDNPAIVVDIAANDPLLDAMALSKGRFAVETAGMPTLYLPSWPEVTRVMEDCR